MIRRPIRLDQIGAAEMAPQSPARVGLMIYLLGAYLLVNAGFVILWWVTDAPYFWPAISIFIWGICLGIYAWIAWKKRGQEGACEAQAPVDKRHVKSN